ncbi:hypothetical protein [Aquimarina rubra]|uniref:Uncharacterized protein n=1 Tax=Aquimarina rubra TaxID=1920033 RepID=A0ABW5LC85_9FLAO
MKITTTIFFSFFLTLATYMFSEVDNNQTKPNTSTTQNDNTKQGTAISKSLEKTKIKVPKNK